MWEGWPEEIKHWQLALSLPRPPRSTRGPRLMLGCEMMDGIMARESCGICCSLVSPPVIAHRLLRVPDPLRLLVACIQENIDGRDSCTAPLGCIRWHQW